MWWKWDRLTSWDSAEQLILIYCLCHHVPQFTDGWLSGKEPFTRFTMLLETSLSWRRCRLWPPYDMDQISRPQISVQCKGTKVIRNMSKYSNISRILAWLVIRYKLLTSTTWVATTPSHQVKSSRRRSCPHVGVAIATPVVEVGMIVLDGVQKRREKNWENP
jgi:hypothetical protein